MTDPSPKPFLFTIEGGNPRELILTVEEDGTVIIHKEGSEPEAAKVFYQYVEIEGKTLLEHLNQWKERALKAEEALKKIAGQYTDPSIIN